MKTRRYSKKKECWEDLDNPVSMKTHEDKTGNRSKRYPLSKNSKNIAAATGRLRKDKPLNTKD